MHTVTLEQVGCLSAGLDATTVFERVDALELTPGSRSYRLREMCWNETHKAAQHTRRIGGCGEDTLVGHARDFATLLDASWSASASDSPFALY